jgi:hypothetical protein
MSDNQKHNNEAVSLPLEIQAVPTSFEIGPAAGEPAFEAGYAPPSTPVIRQTPIIPPAPKTEKGDG